MNDRPPSDREDLRPARALAALMLGDSALRRRFAHNLARLRSLPRRTRRALSRRAAVSLAGLALLLAIGAAPALTAAPAAIIVVNGEVAVADNGKCSLIEAIVNANSKSAAPVHDDCAAGAAGGPDTIILPAGGLFTLQDTVQQGYYGDAGLPRVTSAITLAGNGATIERAEDAAGFRLLEVGKTGSLIVEDLTLRGGSSKFYYGGAIFAQGKLTVTGSTFEKNDADTGGAIAGMKTEIVISSSTITGNTAERGGGVGLNYGGKLTISDTVFSDNYAPGGGAVYMYGGAASLTGNTFSANKADLGGALSFSTTRVSISGGSLTDNQSYNAGALYVYGQNVTLTGVTISGNTADWGAAVTAHVTTLTINQSTISGNETTGAGGAVYVYDTTATLANSTLSDNQALYGGAVYSLNSRLTLANATISGNSAATQGGGLLLDPDSSLALARSLISGNTSPLGREVYAAQAEVTANNFNVFGRAGDAGLDGFSPGATDIVPSARLPWILKPLADNGGPTLTQALAPAGPAVDAAPTADCAPPPTADVDQRGEPRGTNGKGEDSANECDIGAFEAPFGEPEPETYQAHLPFVKR